MSDGNIEFIGRRDQQIKSSGYRVDLSEVESLMLNIPQVGAAASVSSQNDKGENVIVAYFVLNDKVHNDSVDADNLRELIRDKLEKTLPHFMLPEFYVAVSKLPMTPSGKVDRAKLPPSSEADEISKEPLVTETEKTIAAAWASLIDHDYEQLERNSNFFQLGGTSLQAVKAVRLLNEAFSLKLNVKYLFQFGKLKWLAEAIDLLLKRNEVRMTLSVDDGTELDEMEI
jgi:acyl carrier protein